MDDDVREPDGKPQAVDRGESKGVPIGVEFQQWIKSLQRPEVKDPDGHACLTGKCGETIELFLKFDLERVEKAGFHTNGCISSKVCAALAAQMSIGRTTDELLEITGDAIVQELGDFPASEKHCAFLAAETLQEALHDYMIRQGSARRKGGLKP